MGYKNLTEEEQNKFNEQLFKAIKRNTLPAVKSEVKADAYVNAKDNNGDPLLLQTDFIKIMRHLLENGMNPNMQDNYGQSFLHKLSRAENIDSIKLLLEYGADMTLRDKWGRTPFRNALYWGKYDTAELFVLSGYVPSNEEFNKIDGIDEAEQKSLKTRFMTLAAQVQEHKRKLKKEAESQEFSYADEVIEM